MSSNVDVKELDRSKSWRAWLVAVGGFFGQICNVFALATWGMCIAAIAGSFGVAVTALAIGTSMFGVMTGLGSFVAGNLADRIGLRIVQTVGCLGMGIMLIVGSFVAKDATTIIVCYAIAGLFCACVNNGVNPKIGAAWFHPTMRGKGMALVILGGTAAGVVFGIIAPQFLIAGGWTNCFKMMGIIICILGVFVFVLEANDPYSIGTVPFGTPADEEVVVPVKGEKTEEQKAEEKKAMWTCLKMSITWKMAVVFICYQFYNMATQAYATAAILYAGFDAVQAGAVSSITTGAMCVGTIVMPTLSDRFGRKPIIIVMAILGGAATMLEIPILGLNNYTALVITQICVGFFCAINPPIQTAVSEMFPAEHRGTGPGLVGTISGLIGKFFGPLAAAATITAFGGATPMAFLFAGGSLILLAIVTIIWIPNTGGKLGDPNAKAA